MKEEFKLFVRKKPELTSYVNSGEMTWQKFYEQWSLYGEDDNIWSKYKKKEDAKTEESFSFSNLINSVKNVDMNQVQKGVQSLSKAIDLLQGFTTKGAADTATSYEPRQLFKKFED